jgi:enhancing lycopene biosynthesis protein 2
MPKRVGVVLSGCGAQDGSDVREAVLTLLSIERGGADAFCLAPAGVLAEAARIAGSAVRDMVTVTLDDVDALVLPGGAGVATVLSSYADKGVVCDVHPEVARLLRAHLSARRPLGFIGLASILAARVLGPAAGVRLTLGPRGTTAAKHAAVMGADIRPSPVRDIVSDDKARVVSTPGWMYDDARVNDVAVGVDKMVRAVLSLAKDRRPRPAPAPTPDAPAPPPPAPSPTVDPIRRPSSARR